MKSERSTPAQGGCFTCSKGYATYFWHQGRMQVQCDEFGRVSEKDSCEKYHPMRFFREVGVAK